MENFSVRALARAGAEASRLRGSAARFDFLWSVAVPQLRSAMGYGGIAPPGLLGKI